MRRRSFNRLTARGPRRTGASELTWNTPPFLVGNPTINAAGDRMTTTWHQAVTFTGAVDGMGFAGTSAAIDAYVSGDGTSSIVFSLSPPVMNGETVTIDISTDLFASVATGLSNAAIIDHAVTNGSQVPANSLRAPDGTPLRAPDGSYLMAPN